MVVPVVRTLRTIACALALAAAACGSGYEGSDPRIERVDPPSAQAGAVTTIHIIGERFRLDVERDLDHGMPVVGAVTADLGADPLGSVSWKNEELIDAVVPAEAVPGLYPVTVTFSDGRNATLDDAFEVLSCTQYRDVDGDGAGDPLAEDHTCPPPAGYVDNADDCDDDPAACGPGCFPGNGAADVCDGRDQDCDDAVDEDPERTFYRDADGDGFGDPAMPTAACAAPTGYVADATDCADAAGSDPACGGLDGGFCNPGTLEGLAPDPSCTDGADNDCDGMTDALDAKCACGGTCGGCATGGCCTQSCGVSGCVLGCGTACSCVQDCQNIGGTCNPVCSGAGKVCYQDCSGVGDCNAQCDTGATCQIDCTDSSNCRRIDCASGADCVIDCTNAAICDLECHTGSTCLLDCTGATGCRMRTCGGPVQSCPGNLIACNRPCP